MQKNEIIRKLEENDSTILSFPNRGSWGDNRYRGNCSGWIHAFLIWKYHVSKMAELFSGSGTGYDVAKDMGIEYVGADLNPNPVRPGILNVNAVTDDVPEEFIGSDMIFMHPPYGAEIKIPYAGSMYKDPTGELSKSDLGQMPWDKFIKELNGIIMKYYSAMANGSRMAVLMGDVRRGGFHSMFTDIVKPGEVEQVIIKAQHNCVSDGRTYQNRNFVPIVHEYIMVLKKYSPYFIGYQIPVRKELDIRNSKQATWRDVVYAVMQKLGGKASLSAVYAEIKDFAKCANNSNWEAKVRQTLQLNNKLFAHVDNGVWALV